MCGLSLYVALMIAPFTPMPNTRAFAAAAATAASTSIPGHIPRRRRGRRGEKATCGFLPCSFDQSTAGDFDAPVWW